jgi:hypothetical protein
VAWGFFEMIREMLQKYVEGKSGSDRFRMMASEVGRERLISDYEVFIERVGVVLFR